MFRRQHFPPNTPSRLHAHTATEPRERPGADNAPAAVVAVAKVKGNKLQSIFRSPLSFVMFLAIYFTNHKRRLQDIVDFTGRPGMHIAFIFLGACIHRAQFPLMLPPWTVNRQPRTTDCFRIDRGAYGPHVRACSCTCTPATACKFGRVTMFLLFK